jgi:hypothetical protein
MNLDLRLKLEVFNCYRKTLDLNDVVSRIGFQKYVLLQILAIHYTSPITQSILGFKLQKKNFFLLLSLMIKKYLILLLFIRVKRLLSLKFNLACFLIQGVSFFTPKLFALKRNLRKYSSKPLRLRKLNGFLKVKILSISLENLILTIRSYPIAVKLKNVFLSKGFKRVPLFGKPIKKPEYRLKFFIYFLSILYAESLLLAEYVVSLLRKGKKHRKTLQLFTRFFEKIIYSGAVKLRGIQLRVTGKLGGKMRKSKYHYKFGKVQLNTFKNHLSYSCLVAYTRFGIFSIKLWLLKLNDRKRLQKIA